VEAKPDLATMNRQIDTITSQLAHAGDHADAAMRQELDALVNQIKTSQAQFTAEYQKTLDGLNQKLDEATKRAAAAKEKAAAAQAQAAAAGDNLPSFDITPPPPPKSKVDARFGLQLREELLQRFGKPRAARKSEDDREIWEDWSSDDWKP
jgi:hypothetical protein